MPAAPAPSTPIKHFFYHGHRKPPLTAPLYAAASSPTTNPFPQPQPPPPPPPTPPPSTSTTGTPPSLAPPPPHSPPFISPAARRLSPLARYILSSLLRHHRWCPQILSDLSKLRRVTPDIVAEVLRSRPSSPPPSPPASSTGPAARKASITPSPLTTPSLTHSTPQTCSAPPTSSRSSCSPKANPRRKNSSKYSSGCTLTPAAASASTMFYRKMRDKFGVRPRIFLYNRILDSLIRTGHLDLALLVYNDLRADGLKEEPITFTILAKGLCQAGKIDDALQLLDKMRSTLCRPDVFAYTAMIKVLAAASDLNGCLRVWNEMKMDGVKPDVMAYATVVMGLCKAGEVEKGNELFREMKEKRMLIDRTVYAAMIDGFVADGRVGVGCEVLKEMMGDGYSPDLAIYNSLIRGLCGAGKDAKAYKMLQIVVQEGLVLGFETVSPLLASYVDKGEMGSFFKLIERIGELGLRVMDHLVNFFASYVAKGERELKAVEVFEALKGKGYFSIAIYNILIECLSKAKEMKRALTLFDEMKSSKDFQPDSSTFSHIIPCFVEVGDVNKACSCYNQMKEMSWTPSIAAYCSLVRGLCKICEISAAITLVRDCLGNVTNGPMEFKYTLSILNACRSGKPDKVIGVIDEMVEQGYPLEEIIYCAVIHGLCQYAESGEARKVFSVMRERKLLTEANFILYEDLLDEHLKKTTADLVISGLKFFNLESKLKLTSSVD